MESNDLAPFDFHLFSPLKEFLRGTKFEDNKAIKKVVHEWLRQQGKEFFTTGIRKLVEQWDKCLNVGGNYIEK